MQEIEADTGYRPRPHQAEMHREKKRFNLFICHRRFGKTVSAINELIHGALTNTRERPRLGYIAPYYKQAKQIAWDYLKHYSRPIPGTTFNESELRVDFPNGARVTLYGADNPDSLRGIYLDGCVIDEPAQCPRSLYGEVVRPALTDRKGWVIFIGTPKGHDHFYELYKDAVKDDTWLVKMFKASDTGIIEKGELDEARRQMSEDEFEQEFECSFQAAVQGAYYAQALALVRSQHRICRFQVEDGIPVNTVWDLGMDDYTVIGFYQNCGREPRWVDFYENNGEGLTHYKKILAEKDYLYGNNYFPHDVAVKELGTGKSRKEVLEAMGIRVTVAPRLPVEDGIEAARKFLSLCWFHEDKCAQLIDHLSLYRRVWDDKLGVFRDRPVHDINSHAADMFRYAAITHEFDTPHGYMPPGQKHKSRVL